MLTLMLMRHAKSSWEEKGVADPDRPLSARGKRAAQAMGRCLASLKPPPDLVLCSPAHRAGQTWEIAKAELPDTIALQSDERLYDFGDGERVLDCVKAKAGGARCILVIGHNPSLHELAKRLAGSGDKALRARLENKFPTGALAVIAFKHGDWRDVVEGGGELKRFVRPKDILADTGD